MERFLLLYTVGPVQSYIEQAVKLHDLYAGSRMLSKTIQIAMTKIKEQNAQNKIIFPYQRLYTNLEKEETTRESNVISYPNRCVAEIYGERTSIRIQIEGLNQKIREELFEKTFFQDLSVQNGLKNYHVSREYAMEQLQEQFHTYWSVLPFPENKNYEEVYEKLESSMGAVKNLRKFNQISVDNGVSWNGKKMHKRCKICGERNALVINDSDELKANLKPKEQLCAVCYQKRCFEKKITDAFPSTASVALAYWIHQLEQICPEEYRRYKSIFRNNGMEYSEQYLYKVGLAGDSTHKKKSDPLHNVANQLKYMENLLKKNSDTQELKYRYYAIMAFDGDNMGKWISGTFFKKDKIKEAQSVLSEALGNYADWVKNEIRNNGDFSGEKIGSIVYAGGEDLLGLVPLKYLFSVMELLRKQFKEQVSDKVQSYLEEQKELTFSMGVVIAHYKTPLQYVLQMVRTMEKTAKNYREEKDTVALCLMKRSGEIQQTEFPWQSSDFASGYITSCLQCITEIFQKYPESLSFIRKLHSEFEFILQKEKQTGIDVCMIKSEIRRLIEKGSWNSKVEEKENLIKYLNLLLDEIGSDKLAQYINLLYICEFMRRNQNED